MNQPKTKNDLIKATKPKPPLTAYNLYFQVERKRILEGTDSLGLPISSEDMRRASLEHKAKTGKRLHRKTHGKISFKELARVVANRWKKLDPATKQMLEAHAKIEKQEQVTLFEEWKKTDEYEQEKEGKERTEKNFHKITSSCRANEPLAVIEAPAQTVSFSGGRAMRQDLKVCHMSEFEIFQSMWKDLEPIGSMVSRNEVQQCDVGAMFEDDFAHPIGTQHNHGQTNFLFSSDSAHLLEPTPLFEAGPASVEYLQGYLGSKTFTGFGSFCNHAHINQPNHHIEEIRNQCSSNGLYTDLQGGRAYSEDTKQWRES